MVRSGRDSHRWRRRLLDVRHHLHALSSAPPAAAATAACARQQNEQAGREPTNQRQSSSSKKKPEPANNSDEEDEDYGTPLWESDNELYREPSLLPSSAAAVHLPSASLPSPSQAGGGSRAVLITGANRGIGLEFVRQCVHSWVAAGLACTILSHVLTLCSVVGWCVLRCGQVLAAANSGAGVCMLPPPRGRTRAGGAGS
jgi:hypothetical protein